MGKKTAPGGPPGAGAWADQLKQLNQAAERTRARVPPDTTRCDELGHCYHLEADPSCRQGVGRLQRCCHGDRVKRVGG